MYKTALISQGVPQLGGVKQRWYGKTSHTHAAVARLSGVTYRLSCRQKAKLRIT